MSNFTASNRATVFSPEPDTVTVRTADGVVLLDVHGGDISLPALREFFQHERDEQLGRWRWPENPDYVVYPPEAGFVKVLHESTAKTSVFERAWQRIDDDHDRAARAYFDAHPESKPWQNAEYGELWSLDVIGTSMWVVLEAGDDDEPRPVFRDIRTMVTLSLDDIAITGGRRVWPEATS